MAKSKGVPSNGKEVSQQSAAAAISARGVKTGQDFADLMSTLMGDLLGGRVTPQVGNAVVNAGGKLLKVVEMQHKYGTPADEKNQKVLVLATGA